MVNHSISFSLLELKAKYKKKFLISTRSIVQKTCKVTKFTRSLESAQEEKSRGLRRLIKIEDFIQWFEKSINGTFKSKVK